MSKGKIAGSIVALIAVVALIATFQTSNVSQTRNLSETISDVFTQWKIVYGKSYASADEEAHRFQTFQDNFYFVQEFNANPEHTSTVGLNEFADLNTQEFKALKTCLGMAQPTTTTSEPKTLDVEAVNALPTSVDWRTKNAVTPVKNQGDCGSCWSFSTTGSLEGLHAIKDGSLLSFSEQQLVDCSSAYGNQGCDGGWPFWALQYTAAKGIELESTYPYTGTDGTCAYAASKVAYKNSGFTNVTKNNEVDLATAVVQQPISICVEADQPVFQLYTGGIITSASCGTQLDHAILIVGYNVQGSQQYWIVKNSWGASWGLAGYLYIGKSTSTNTDGVCGIAMQPTYPTA